MKIELELIVGTALLLSRDDKLGVDESVKIDSQLNTKPFTVNILDELHVGAINS